MGDKTLEAVIKLKDEITKPLQNVQKELNNVVYCFQIWLSLNLQVPLK